MRSSLPFGPPIRWGDLLTLGRPKVLANSGRHAPTDRPASDYHQRPRLRVGLDMVIEFIDGSQETPPAYAPQQAHTTRN